MTTDITQTNLVSTPVAATAADPITASPRKGRTWQGFVRDVCLYLVTYVVVSTALIGPLFWTWFGAVYADGPKWVAYLFLPLAALCEWVPFVRWLVNLWINWWIL